MWAMFFLVSKSSFSVVLALLFLLNSIEAIDNYKTYLYDGTVAQFTPDGRLLQVEYATQAAEESSPVLVAPLSSDLVVFLCVKSSIHDRLIVLEDVLIVPSGILPDSIVLLQHVHAANRRNRERIKAPLSALAMGQAIAEECHKHAFGGGLRVYGSTMMLSTAAMDGGQHSSITHWQTDPSGALQALDMKTPRIIGGGSKQSLYQRKLDKLMSALNRVNSAGRTHQQTISRLANFARDELGSKAHNSNEQSAGNSRPELVEIAFVSSAKGVYKPSASQLESIIQ